MEWTLAPTVPTREQFIAGAQALKLPFLKKGKLVVEPVLVGPHRPGFILEYAAMVESAPQHPEQQAPQGHRWCPRPMTDAQWRAAVNALRLVPAYTRKLLADSAAKARSEKMYLAMLDAADGS